jgi:hypothetical protein
MKRWPEALDILLKRAGVSKRSLMRDKLAAPEQVTRWKKSPRGPSVEVLERIIYGLHLTWKDWAEACDEVEQRSLGSPETKGAKPTKSVKGAARASFAGPGKKGVPEVTYELDPWPLIQPQRAS